MTSSETPSSRQLVCPDGTMELVIHLKERALHFFERDGKRHSIRVPLLAGPYSRSFYIDPSEFSAVIGIRFHPGAARMVFPVAAYALHNTDIPLAELYPEEADRLLNELCSASGERSQVLVIERFLQRRLANAAPLHPAIRYAVKQLSQDGAATVRDIQSNLGLSHTRFIQLFREHVGLTPKLFCRVRRFRNMLSRIEKGMPVNWAELAADCGYFDQAHLIRDFHAFAGVTPVEYNRTIPDSEGKLAAKSNAS
jgi:AraC-like DNA-binding protein